MQIWVHIRTIYVKIFVNKRHIFNLPFIIVFVFTYCMHTYTSILTNQYIHKALIQPPLLINFDIKMTVYGFNEIFNEKMRKMREKYRKKKNEN